MLPRQFRLDRTEFETIKRSGTLRSGRLMGVLVFQGQGTCFRPELRSSTPRLRRSSRGLSSFDCEVFRTEQPEGLEEPSGAKGQVRESTAKAGIIVSKKISTKATERNQLKRRLRAALVRILPELSNVHVVVLPTRRAMGGTVRELEEEFERLLNGQNG